MRNETKQKNTEAVKLELERRYQEIIEQIFFEKKKKTASTKKAAAQAESEARRAQAKENDAAAAGTICENAEAKTEEVERMCKGNIMSDSVVTANGMRRRKSHRVQRRPCQTT